LDRMFEEMDGFASRSRRRLLIVEDNDVQGSDLVEFLRNEEVEVVRAATAGAALAAMGAGRFDTIVVDLGLPDMSGVELIHAVQKLEGGDRLPVIVHTARDVGGADEKRLRTLANSVIVKDVRSLDRLLDEVTLHLHLPLGGMSPAQRDIV